MFESDDSSSFSLISFTPESPCEALVLLKTSASLQQTLLSGPNARGSSVPTRVRMSDSSESRNRMIYTGGSLCTATLFLHPSRGGETSEEEAHQSSGRETLFPRHGFYRVMCVSDPNHSPQRELSEKWHRITEKYSIKSTSLLNEKIKLLQQMHNQEKDYDLHW